MADSSTTTTDQGKTDTQDTKSTDSTKTLDLKSLSGDQLAQVLENPELWKLPRIAELREHSSAYKKSEQDRQQREEASLTEQKKFQELAEKKTNEAKALQDKVTAMQMDQALTALLIKENVVDLPAALTLADRAGLKLDDAGNVSGAEDVVKGLKEGKAYLFGQGSTAAKTLGTATNNQGTTTATPSFNRSQLQDREFYLANRDDILKAQREGRIVDDITPRQ